jgi:hypothetical protein
MKITSASADENLAIKKERRVASALNLKIATRRGGRKS